MATETKRHYAHVVPADPAGMVEMFQARCTCDWTSEPTPERGEADEDGVRHARENYVPTWDDICWNLGIGRWAQ